MERGKRLLIRALREVCGVDVPDGTPIEELEQLLAKQGGMRRIGGVLTSVVARPSPLPERWGGAQPEEEKCEQCRGHGGLGDGFYPTADCHFVVYPEYCDCRAGQERRARDQQQMERYRATRLASMLAEAQIPPRFRDHTLASFPGDRRARELVRAWVEKKAGANLFLWGPYGTGKTGLAVAALKGRIGGGQAGRFVDCQLLMQEMRLKRGDPNAVTALIGNCLTVPLLVLDDVRTSERSGDDSWVVDFALEKLTLLVGTRYNAGLPLIVTTNYDPAGLAEDVGPRLASRMQEDALIVEVKAPSLRRIAQAPTGF